MSFAADDNAKNPYENSVSIPQGDGWEFPEPSDPPAATSSESGSVSLTLPTVSTLR